MASQASSEHEAEAARKALARARPKRHSPAVGPAHVHPGSTTIQFGPDGIVINVAGFTMRQGVHVGTAPVYRTTAEARAAYEEMRRQFEEFGRQASRAQERRAPTDEELAAERRWRADYERRQKENPDWGKPRPGVKFPRGGRG